MLPVRVFFKKKGIAAYISHLDLQRTVFRALVRSGVSPCYTEGFNPHIKLAFAMPLSVYQESEYEIFDFFSSAELSYEEITERLKASFPESIEIINAASPVSKITDLALADYTVILKTSKNAEEIKALLSGEITVLKRSKKGDAMTDVSGMIKKTEFSDSGDDVVIKLRCACGSAEHLNVKYITDFLGENITDSRIIRNTMLKSDGSLLT